VGTEGRKKREKIGWFYKPYLISFIFFLFLLSFVAQKNATNAVPSRRENFLCSSTFFNNFSSLEKKGLCEFWNKFLFSERENQFSGSKYDDGRKRMGSKFSIDSSSQNILYIYE
jgi:hypothetical protein